MASADDPLRHLLTDPRALHARPVDALWVRLVDVGAALSARRYPAPIDLVFEVRDEFCPWNDGRWHVWGHPAGAFCDRTDRDPDLVLGIEELSAAYLGGVSLATLQAAGRVTEISPGRGDARVDGVLLAGHAVVPGGVLTWQRPGRSPSTGRTSRGPAG